MWIFHPSVVQTKANRNRRMVATNISAACLTLTGLNPAGMPRTKLKASVGMLCDYLQSHSGGAYTLEVSATPTSFPSSNQRHVATTIESARETIVAKEGVAGLFSKADASAATKTAAAGKGLFTDLPKPGAGSVCVGTWPNMRQATHHLHERWTSWTVVNLFVVAKAGSLNNTGLETAKEKVDAAGDNAMCLGRLSTNDRGSETTAGNSSASLGETAASALPPDLRYDLGLVTTS